MSVVEAAAEAANRIIHGDASQDDVQLVAGVLLQAAARLREYEEALTEIAEWYEPNTATGPSNVARAALAGDTDG